MVLLKLTDTVEKNKVQSQIESRGQGKLRLEEQVERLNERKEQILMSMEESDDPLDEMRLELEEKLEKQLNFLKSQVKLSFIYFDAKLQWKLT